MRHIREKVEKELKRLEHELRYELPKEIEKATALGDLRENAEYHAALERQNYVRARIAQLQKKLGQLGMIRLEKLPKDRAGLGSVITVQDLDSEEEVVYELVFSDEGDPKVGKISLTSPIGKALTGKRVGDEVVARTPRGQREFEVIDLVTLHERDDAEVVSESQRDNDG